MGVHACVHPLIYHKKLPSHTPYTLHPPHNLIPPHHNNSHVVKMRLTCTSESDASTVVTTVQAAVRSPDLQHMTVVINPKSGRGKYV